MQPPPKKNPLGMTKSEINQPRQPRPLPTARPPQKPPKESSGAFAKLLFFLLLVGLAGGAYWWYINQGPVSADTRYKVYDKLLVPGSLLRGPERSHLGYEKTKWVEPKFIFYVIGEPSGELKAYEVDEMTYLQIPRNTIMAPDEFLSPAPMITAVPNSGSENLVIMRDLMRFSSQGEYVPTGAPAEEPSQ